MFSKGWHSNNAMVIYVNVNMGKQNYSAHVGDN